MVWDPKRITPQSWAAAVVFYRRIEDRNDDFRPLRVLAEHIASQPYAEALYGATSGTALLVAPASDADWAHDSLRVDVDLGGTIRFVGPQSPPEVLRSEGERIVETFERFVRKAKWA